ncbi:G patch domain and ankyrin repeat-containing protein 1 G5 protein HLA-B-associated transcript 4 [Channa argus]|uniref:G patch domain and ankyrin repeat-containing protein 1 G5 protein HLA-B-associated transcript 4 n=1 Tax=Channa argus TaxID=215402 RepID=A0A6G1PCB4_CHAAH|nr:G patch domain and ankyrin repeat-containing protein 1 G5 protein HLA-B-associated transcript 4 [Channa argus]
MAGLGFIPASSQDVFSVKTEQSTSKTTPVLSGEEARQFYENLMKDDNEQFVSSAFNKTDAGRLHQHQRRQKNRESRKRARRRARVVETPQVQTHSVAQREINEEGDGNPSIETNNSERTKELQGLRLLRCAHEGDTTGLKELLLKGADINFQDTFFWTAVMCASWSGQKAAVRLLLQQGAAWVGVVDTQGRDAKDLALEAGHIDIFEELENYGRSSRIDKERNSSASQPKRCEVCCAEYSSSLSTHLSSTLHQFSLRHPPPTPYYCLPPSSNCYKMMVRCGWKPGTGLGPEGEGSKQPVPTVLKRDQKGLGYGQIKRAKVTHFRAGDHEAVKQPSKHKNEILGKGKRKEESMRKEQNDRNWERDFRASFYL